MRELGNFAFPSLVDQGKDFQAFNFLRAVSERKKGRSRDFGAF